MSEEIKKEMFLKILESLFGDKSKEIQKENCISFYHYLVDTLQDRIIDIPEDEDASISLCFAISEMLRNFDLLHEDLNPWTPMKISQYLIDYAGITLNEFRESMIDFRRIYILIKDEFILGL